MALADFLPSAMEVNYIFASRIVWSEIRPATEPCCSSFSRSLADVTKIRVHSWHIGISRVNHYGDPGCRKAGAFARHASCKFFRKRTSHLREVHPRLLKHCTIHENASDSFAARQILPSILAKSSSASTTPFKFLDHSTEASL